MTTFRQQLQSRAVRWLRLNDGQPTEYIDLPIMGTLPVTLGSDGVIKRNSFQFLDWTVDTDSGGISVPSTEESLSEITGWIEGIRLISVAGVNAATSGIFSEVGGLEDVIWAGVIGANNTLIKYPVHGEVTPDDNDAGSNRLFYVHNQKLKLVIANAVSAVSPAITVRVKYVPDII